MIVLTGTTTMPIFAYVDKDKGYDETKNARPAWVDEMPDPDQELQRYLNMEV